MSDCVALPEIARHLLLLACRNFQAAQHPPKCTHCAVRCGMLDITIVALAWIAQHSIADWSPPGCVSRQTVVCDFLIDLYSALEALYSSRVFLASHMSLAKRISGNFHEGLLSESLLHATLRSHVGRTVCFTFSYWKASPLWYTVACVLEVFGS